MGRTRGWIAAVTVAVTVAAMGGVPAAAKVPSGTHSLDRADVKITGDRSGGAVGTDVALVGDLDGDGFDDVAVGAYQDDTNGEAAGAAYILYGPITGRIDLAEADAKLLGERPGEFAGEILAGGDLDGDGFDDLLAPAPGNALNQPGDLIVGVVHVLYGGPERLSGTAGLSEVSDAQILGEHLSDFFGFWTTVPGDLDGDGRDDLAIGASSFGGTFPAGTGKVYLAYGDGERLDGPVDVTDIADAAFIGEHPSSFAGWVEPAGDLDGDGADELLIGAQGWGGTAGAAYLLYGGERRNGTSSLALAADVRITGAQPADIASTGLAGAGDLDGDGFDDIAVGAPSLGGQPGSAYVFYGGQDRIGGHVSVTDADATIEGEAEGDGLGRGLAIADDVDGDGLADLVIGAPGNDAGGEDAGVVYIVPGGDRPARTSTVDDLAVLTLVGEEPGDTVSGLGWGIDGTGDLNRDGRADLLIGATGHDAGGEDAGAVYGIFGVASGGPPGSGPSEQRELATVGFKLDSPVVDDGAGFWTSVGDFDGDGVGDLAVGALCDDTNGPAAGAVYVLYGPVSAQRSLADADAKLLGARAGDFVGEILAVADIDGDDADELVVTAPGPFVGSGPVADVVNECVIAGPVQPGINRPGEAYVLRGGQRLSGEHDAVDVADAVITGLTPTDWTGFGAGSGDLEGDGNDELILGDAFPKGSGQAFVFAGDDLPDGTTLGAEARLVGEQPADLFSFRVVSGDVNGDGADDLLVSAPGVHPARAGTVYVFLGGSVPSGVTTALAADLILEGEPGDTAGRGLAADDLDGDDVDDIVVGARGTGTTYVFYGPVTGGGRMSLSEADVEVRGDPDGQPGNVVAVGNLGRQDRSDLLIGAPLDTTGGELAGAVHRLTGPLEGEIDATGAGSLLVGEPGDMAGYDLAVGNVTGGRIDDLVVGAPSLETPGQSGAVYIVPGGGSVDPPRGAVEHRPEEVLNASGAAAPPGDNRGSNLPTTGGGPVALAVVLLAASGALATTRTQQP